MLEELNYQEMSEIKGGSSAYCDSLQEWANTHYDNPNMPDEYWDEWADLWIDNCSN